MSHSWSSIQCFPELLDCWLHFKDTLQLEYRNRPFILSDFFCLFVFSKVAWGTENISVIPELWNCRGETPLLPVMLIVSLHSGLLHLHFFFHVFLVLPIMHGTHTVYEDLFFFMLKLFLFLEVLFTVIREQKCKWSCLCRPQRVKPFLGRCKQCLSKPDQCYNSDFKSGTLFAQQVLETCHNFCSFI